LKIYATTSSAIESYPERERLNQTISQKIDTDKTEVYSAEILGNTCLKMGNSLYEQGRYNEAVQSYEKAILLNPQLEAAWLNKGNVLYVQSNYDEALQAFDRATKINPQNAIAWRYRGLTLMKLDRSVEANAAFIRGKVDYTG
jgi:tetratricopeptide (TPR) repeat protein